MSLRRQAYEWRNIVPVGSNVSNTGHPILTYDAAGAVQATVRQIDPDRPIDIMIGGVGNNLEEPAELRANQFIVIDSVAFGLSLLLSISELAQLDTFKTPLEYQMQV